MVITSCNEPTATAPGTSVPPTRTTSFKQQRKKRGLSAFYHSRSQSFNCMRDLQKNPFCKSTMMLAKPDHQTPSLWQQQFGSIQEDMCEFDSVQQQRHQEEGLNAACAQTAPASLARRSWDGCPAGSSDMAAAAWPLGVSHPAPGADMHPVQDQLLQQQAGFYAGSSGFADPAAGVLASRCVSLGTSRCVSLDASLSSSSNSYSSSMEACGDPLVDAAGDVCSSQHQATDTLCLALHAASLAGRQQPPQLVTPLVACSDWS